MPVLAPGTGASILTGVAQVAAAGRPEAVAPSGHTCACLSSGQAVCWGQNTWGQVCSLWDGVVCLACTLAPHYCADNPC